MSATAPEISVILCVKDGMPLLREQLAALGRQDWDGHWELIVSDNGCTDDSTETARGAAGIPTVRVADARARPGLGYARNAGVVASKGTWVLFCDADDVVADDWIREARLAFGRSDFIAGFLRVDGINPVPVATARPSPTPDALPVALAHLPYAVGANFGVRREVFLAVGGCDERFTACGDDVDLSWRLTGAGYSPLWVPNLIVDYRLRSTREDLWRQQSNYGKAEVLLYTLHAALGCPRPSNVGALKEWVFLVSRVHLIRRRDDAALLWLRTAARHVGHVRGSAAYRTMIL